MFALPMVSLFSAARLEAALFLVSLVVIVVHVRGQQQQSLKCLVQMGHENYLQTKITYKLDKI
jgi:hypothetical protein